MRLPWRSCMQFKGRLATLRACQPYNFKRPGVYAGGGVRETPHRGVSTNGCALRLVNTGRGGMLMGWRTLGKRRGTVRT